MKHDDTCELVRTAENIQGPTCHCAQRAYERDPLPGVDPGFGAPPVHAAWTRSEQVAAVVERIRETNERGTA